MNTAVSSKIQRVVKVVVSEKTSKVVPHITDEMARFNHLVTRYFGKPETKPPQPSPSNNKKG
jgi:hypothetical protein